MAATVSIKQATGSSPTNTTITNLRFCSNDVANDTTTYPLVKPSAGLNYSYVAWVFLNADTTPTGTINNVKFYTDGSSGWTGITAKGIQTGTYAQATGTSGTSGDLSATVYTAGTDIFTYTSGSPLSVTGSLSNPSTGRIANYVAVQLAVSTSAVAGTVTAETFTKRYDET